MVEDIFIILFGLLSIECMDEYEKEKRQLHLRNHRPGPLRHRTGHHPGGSRKGSHRRRSERRKGQGHAAVH